MPFTINGIGTCYYGKRRPLAMRGTCASCGRVGMLSSYDTTLFFVVVFVPILPLGRKRVLEDCPSCRMHRVLDLGAWERAKEADVRQVLDRLERNPEDREAASRGIALTAAYQDETLLHSVTEALGDGLYHDAAIQAQLGDTYAFFGRWARAEDAYRNSLGRAQDPSVREALAWTLLMQNRPEEAEPYLQHVLRQEKQAGAYLIFHLISSYQAEGKHDEALRLMDARDEVFPEQAALPESKAQRKASTLYQGTQKKVTAAALSRTGGARYVEPGWGKPALLAACVVLLLLAAYCGRAAWLGYARKVHFVNGTRAPYDIEVAGAVYTLQPGRRQVLYVPEGDLEMRFVDAKLGLPPVQAHFESPFWSRPFSRRTYIANPDQGALVVQERTVYMANPPKDRPGDPPVVHFGRAFYELADLDFEFEPFPRTISVERGGGQVVKTRVDQHPTPDELGQIAVIMNQLAGKDQVAFCDRMLCFEPGNWRMIYWLTTHPDVDGVLRLYEARLGQRPILVDFHRAYQTLMERARPETDLRPRYEKLVADSGEDSGALYLLGRIQEDLEEGDRLFRRALEKPAPTPYAYYGLAYRALSDARFAEAAELLDRALKAEPRQATFRQFYYDALLAAGQQDRLLKELRHEAENARERVGPSIGVARVLAIQGLKAEARIAVTHAVQVADANSQAAVRAALEALLPCWERDVTEYLKAAPKSFETAWLQGQLPQAAELVTTLPQEEQACGHGLVYLAARRARDAKLAEAQWQALLESLRRAGRDERRFADVLAEPKLPEARWRRLPLDPQVKRVLLAVLAERHPGQAPALRDLAAQLNFQRDALALCLDQALRELPH